jgi:hypothetical protein
VIQGIEKSFFQTSVTDCAGWPRPTITEEDDEKDGQG